MDEAEYLDETSDFFKCFITDQLSQRRNSFFNQGTQLSLRLIFYHLTTDTKNRCSIFAPNGLWFMVDRAGVKIRRRASKLKFSSVRSKGHASFRSECSPVN